MNTERAAKATLTAVITDYIAWGGKTSEEERAEIVEDLRRRVGLNPHVVLSSDYSHHLASVDAEFELQEQLAMAL